MVLATALCAATAALVWLGYEATQEARRSNRLLLERRVAEQLALLSAGLTQDMRGAQATVLTPIRPDQLVQEPPYDLAEAFARGFARFPYPEFFFTWNGFKRDRPVTYMFTRADRAPAWYEPDPPGVPYPVDVARDPSVLRDIVDSARAKTREQRPVAAFDATIDGTPYQIVVNFLYDGVYPAQLAGLVGFAVNLQWVRDVYFKELAFQIERIGGVADEMAFEILDDRGRPVTSTSAPHERLPSARRPFPLVFVDRALLSTFPHQENGGFPTWTAHVSVAAGSPMARSTEGVDSTFVLISISALATVAGLVLTVRGVRVASELATMKSDFVSSVTHELKTPLAVIRLIADTLAQGRYVSEQTVRDYAALLWRETRNLGRLTDNLLTYARLSDVRHAYTFEPVEVADLVDDALEHFQTLLAEQRFAVDVDVPADLPPVAADRLAALQALDNIIDNAIKFSEQQRCLRIRAGIVGEFVAVTVSDRGIGIPEDELSRVSDKFFRGREVKRGGSGLGLAIVRQIVEAHRGRLGIHSEPGRGTEVEMQLPVARV